MDTWEERQQAYLGTCVSEIITTLNGHGRKTVLKAQYDEEKPYFVLMRGGRLIFDDFLYDLCQHMDLRDVYITISSIALEMMGWAPGVVM